VLGIELDGAIELGMAFAGALALASLLAAAVLAWIVARMGPREEGRFRTIVPVLVIGAVGSFLLGFLVAAILIAGVLVSSAFDGMWPIILIDVVAVAGFGAMQIAPLLVARLARSCSPAAARWQPLVTGAIWAVILSSVVGLAARVLRLLWVPFAVAPDDPSLPTGRLLDLVNLVAVIAAMLLVTVVAVRLGQVVATRLAVLRTSR